MGAGGSAFKLPIGESRIATIDNNNEDSISIVSTQGNHRTLLLIINNDGSRIALMKYLKKTGIACYMDFYFEVENIKVHKADEVYFYGQVLVNQYRQTFAMDSTKLSYENIWRTIEQNDLANLDSKDSDPAVIIERFKLAQKHVLGYIASRFDDFLDCSYYRNWQKEQKAKENERFGESVETSSKKLAMTGPVRNCSIQYPQVLIIDDSIIATKINMEMLKRHGHSVEKATNGRAGLELLSTKRFDIVLVDLHMPIMDGFATIQHFRQLQRDCSTRTRAETESFREKSIALFPAVFSPAVNSFPVAITQHKSVLLIGMSSDNDADTISLALNSGFDFFIPKPFSMVKFVDIVSQANS